MKSVMFFILMAMSSMSMAATPYVKAFWSSADDDCASGCNGSSELEDPGFSLAGGGYFGDRYILGAEIAIGSTDRSASIYAGMNTKGGILFAAGAGAGRPATDIPNVTGRVVDEDSATSRFTFAEAAYKWAFIRYTIADVDSDYTYRDQVGIDANGDPVYDPAVSEESNIDRSIITVGARVLF